MQEIEIIGWLILRIAYAWLYFYALIALLRDWPSTEDMVALLFPYQTRFFAILMIIIMVIAPLAILIGIYAEIAGFCLLIYNLLGAIIHYKLARFLGTQHLSDPANVEDKNTLASVIQIGSMGNITSAQKNIVLAAVAAFFMLVGSGPASLTMPLWH